MHAVTCPSCSRGIPIPPGERLPPWCSACGANLPRDLTPTLSGPRANGVPPPAPVPPPPKVPPTEPERVEAPRPVVPQSEVTVPPAAGSLTPQYFHGCVPQVLSHERLVFFRFYAVRGELLVFPAGLGNVVDGQFVPLTRVSRVIGGIGHGAGQISAGRRANDLTSLEQSATLAKLDGSSDEVLAEMARITPGAVAVPAADLVTVSIAAPGFLFTLFRGFRCEAVLRLGYPLGTLALPSVTDARRAVEGLRGLIGPRLRVDLPWGKRT